MSARIGPNDRLGSPLVTYSPEQLAEIDALRARIAELEGKLAEAEPLLRQWFGLFGFTDHAPEALSEATDAALSNPSPSAQALTRLLEAVDNLLNTPMGTKEWDQAMDAVGEDYDAYQAARTGRGEGE